MRRLPRGSRQHWIALYHAHIRRGVWPGVLCGCLGQTSERESRQRATVPIEQLRDPRVTFHVRNIPVVQLLLGPRGAPGVRRNQHLRGYHGRGHVLVHLGKLLLPGRPDRHASPRRRSGCGRRSEHASLHVHRTGFHDDGGGGGGARRDTLLPVFAAEDQRPGHAGDHLLASPPRLVRRVGDGAGNNRGDRQHVGRTLEHEPHANRDAPLRGALELRHHTGAHHRLQLVRGGHRWRDHGHNGQDDRAHRAGGELLRPRVLDRAGRLHAHRGGGR
mmetsp:Transcript_8899/g.21989  ORF Transcript_8899/g.21989 Transcript_8899/m.21989 type:complete len:274 (+) Transcript_8899:752-1573(+)